MIPETESLSMLNAISEWHIHHPIIQLQPIIFCNTKHKTKAWMTLDASPASIRAVPVGGRKKHAARLVGLETRPWGLKRQGIQHL